MNQASDHQDLSLSFDPLVAAYDRTRTFDAERFNAALDWLTAHYPARDFPTLFEPGIGTGRIALPLLQRGYRVVGIDIAPAMLKLLAEHSAALASPDRLAWLVGDAVALPFRDRTFDLCIVVHVFYFIAQWQRAVQELLRVLKPQGTLILMHTGTGMEVPFLNARYMALCASAGYRIPTIGVQSTREVTSYLTSCGWSAAEIAGGWSWSAHICLQDALADLQNRAYSFTTSTPAHIHTAVIAQLRAELAHEYGDLAVTVEVPNQIRFVVISAAKAALPPHEF